MTGSIDIDIGGTFTDCFARLDSRVAWCKTRTTGYDLSRGMLQAIDEAASRLGVGTADLLGQADIIRYSTTLALNSLLERNGPKLGYITTEGFEDHLLIGRGSQWSDGLSFKEQRNVARARKPHPLIEREAMVGVKERMDHRGREVRPLDEEDFLRKLDYLVDTGVRGFVVCLLWSHVNPAHEVRIRELIELEYGESYLGHTPVFLSSENSPRRLEYTRGTTTVLNAYLHTSMYDELSGIGQRLRAGGYRAPLIMVHNTGGMASVLRSSAIQTFSGGPVAGLMGGAHLGHAYGFGNVVVTDMGGTSFDVGLIVHGSTRFYQLAPTIDHWLVDATMLDTHSIGAGGGSIARINADVGGRLEVGPESAGSMPGPACYGQGGREPTVTDADLVLGYVNPGRFNGGRLPVSTARAERALRDKIAGPLGLSVTDAAVLVKQIVDAHMGAVIHKETVLKGYDPQDFVIFAAGGAGPLHACGYAEAAGMTRVVIFPFAPIFCAYGSSTMDVLHVYERSAHFTLFDGSTGEWLTATGGFNAVVDALAAQAARDYSGEGLDAEAVEYELELDMKFGGQLNVKRVAAPSVRLDGPEDVRRLYQAFETEYSEAYSPLGLNPGAGVEIDALVLKARLRQRPAPPPAPARPAAGPVSLGVRPAVWELGSGAVDTPVFEAAALPAGTKIDGPALVEAETTTTAVAPGWTLVVDERSAFILTHTGGSVTVTILEDLLARGMKPEPPSDADLEAVAALRLGDYEILSEKLVLIAQEGKEVMTRMGISSMLHSGDTLVGVYTAAGDLVAPVCGTYLHSVTGQIPIKFILAQYRDDPSIGVGEGDIFYCNEALYGGIHNPDQFALMPVFNDGELVAWAVCGAHQSETGGSDPGGEITQARTRHDEGMKLSPIKIGENYTLRGDVLRMMENFISRAPRMQVTDVKARVSACDRVRLRLQELARARGNQVLRGLFRRMIQQTSAGVRRRIASWPDGTYRHVVFMDTTGHDAYLLRASVAITVAGDRLTIDFAGTSPEHEGSYNAFAHIIAAHSAVNLYQFPFHDFPISSGMLENIDIRVPKGSFFDADSEAAVSCSPLVGALAFPLLGVALSKIMYSTPQRDLVCGFCTSSASAVMVSGVNQHGYKVTDFMGYPLNAYGLAARHDMDGVDVFGFPHGPWGKAPDVEDIEQEFPLLHLYEHQLTDSGGFGRFRGGCGAAVCYMVYGSRYLAFTSSQKESKFPSANGLFGGYAATTLPGIRVMGSDLLGRMRAGEPDIPVDDYELAVADPGPGEVILEHQTRGVAVLREGDILAASTNGGGGYGDVLERDPEAVLTDVLRSTISADVARDVYHVVFDPETMLLDLEGTRQAREAELRARARRGRPYAEFVAQWQARRPPEEILTYYGEWPSAAPNRDVVRI